MPSLEEGSQGAVFICQAGLDVEAEAGLPAAHVLGTCLHRDIACPLKLSGCLGASRRVLGFCFLFCSDLYQPNVKRISSSYQMSLQLSWCSQALEGSVEDFMEMCVSSKD